MAIALTVLLSLLSMGILAGRVYEILKLTDAETGFFIYKGIVFNPYILIIFLIITVCCAVIIFGGNKNVQPFFSKSSKIISVAAGAMFIVYSIMALKYSPAVLFVLAGGIALVVMGIFELKPQLNAVNIAVSVLSVIFIAGLCLDVIIFNVNTIHNIEFVKNALSYIFAGLFILQVMKNVFAPSVYSPMFLYITGIMAFVMCTVMQLADIIAMIADGQAVLPKLFFNAGFVFLGFFALDNAVSVMPKKITEGKTEADDRSEIIAEKDVKISVFKCSTESAVAEKEEASPEKFAQMYAQSASAAESEQKNTVMTQKSDARKFTFGKNSKSKETQNKKDGEKVVYKKPK